MLTASDLLRLPYTPNLTEGGITYAIRSLPYTYNRMGGSLYNRLRRIVAGVAAELAFRRYLSQEGIPFDVHGATPFTEPDRYDVALGGHRCDLKSFLISNRAQIAALRSNPELLLKAPALVPLDQHTGGSHRPDDLYVFAFLFGLITASRSDLRKALDADQPVYLTHPLPRAWSKPANWVPLGPLALKSESDEPLTIELGGQTEEREFLTYSVELPGKERILVEEPFYSLSALHIDQLPGARIGLHSAQIGKTYLIDPYTWGNLWVYGTELILVGYIPYEEFRRRARLIQPGSRVVQYHKTRTRNLAVPVEDLKPLDGLFEKVRAWEQFQKAED